MQDIISVLTIISFSAIGAALVVMAISNHLGIINDEEKYKKAYKVVCSLLIFALVLMISGILLGAFA